MAARAEPVVTELTIDGSGATRGQEQYVRAMNAAQTAMEKTMAVNTKLYEVQSQQARVNQQVAAANDNLAKSYRAANDNYQSFSKGLVDGASGVLETASHLKLVAVAAYALSPAFRAVVATGVAGTLSLLGANAGLAAAAMSRAVAIAGPALSFFARLSVPILVLVGVFKLLSDTIERGSTLLEKYGGTAGQRAMFGTGVEEGLAKLTRFQDETVSAQQLQYATQLGSRLEEAKRTLSEFAKVQLDLTDPALKLQNIWVVIVETFAKALTLAGQLPQAMAAGAQAIGQSSIWDKLPKVSAAQEAAIIARIDANNGLVEQVAKTAEESFELAKKRLAAGMGGGFVGRFNQSIMDLANPPKPEETKEIKAASDAWTRYADQVAKATAAREADVRTVGLGVQAHEQLRVQLQGEQILEREGVKDTEARRAKLAELAKQAGDTALALALTKAQNQADFTSKTMFFSPEELAVAQAMNHIWGNEWPQHTQDNLALQIKFNVQTAQVRDLLSGAATSFVSDLARGVGFMDALASAAGRLGQTLIDIGSKQVLGQLFGALSGAGMSQYGGGGAGDQGPVQSSAGGLGGAAAGAGLGSMIGSLGAAAGPIALVAGVGLSLITGMMERSKKEKEEAEKNKQAWEASRGAAETFKATMLGISRGSLITDKESAFSQMTGFVNQAAAAKDWASVRQLQEAYNTFVTRSIQDFSADWFNLAEAFRNGQGTDNPFEKARLQIKDLTAELVGFVENTRYTTGTALSLPGGPEMQAAAVAAAQQATASYALSLLALPKPLSDTAQALQEMLGKAQQMPDLLMKLGMSAEQAAAAVSQHLNAALDDLRNSFTADIGRKTNDALGLSYLNDVGDLIASVAQMTKDAQSLGADPALITRFFEVSAQKIVDGAQLTGQAFNDLIVQFPNLANVVHEFSQALSRSAADIASERLGLQNRLFAAGIDTGTEAGALASFDRAAAYEKTQTALENLPLLEQTLAAERLNIQRDFAEKALDVQRQQQEKMLDLARSYSSYIDQLLGGSGTTLAPRDRLATTDRALDQQYALAQSGDAAAQGNLTQYLDRYLEAARDMYGSTQGYIAIRDTEIARLRGLAATMNPGAINLATVGGAPVSPVTSLPVSLPAQGNGGNPAAEIVALRQQVVALTGTVERLLTATNQKLDQGNQVDALGHEQNNGVLKNIDGKLGEMRDSALLEAAKPQAA